MATQIQKTAEEFGIDDPEAYNRETRERLKAAIDDHAGETSVEHREAIEALGDPTPEGEGTVTVGDVEMEVKNYLNGRIERKFQRLQSAERRGETDPDLAREGVIDIITWLIEAPEEYADPETWRAYAEEYGTLELQFRAIEAGKLYRERLQEIENSATFRGDE